MYMCLAEMLAQLMKDAAVVIVAGGLVAAFVAYACCVVGGRSEQRWRSAQAVPCADSGYTWKIDQTDLTGCETKIQENGIFG